MKFTMLMIDAHPEHGQRDGDGDVEGEGLVGEREREAGDAHVEVEHHADRGELPGELQERTDVEEVVDEPDQRDDRPADEDRFARVAHLHQGQRRHHHADVHGEAAQQRHGGVVHVPLVGGSHDRARPPGDPAHQRGDEVDDARRQDEAGGGEQDARGRVQESVYGTSSRCKATPASENMASDSSSG